MARQNSRARPPRTFDLARSFYKDWDRLSRSGRYEMRALKEEMMLLVTEDMSLEPEWTDPPLNDESAGTRLCHIGGDFLLIYEVDDAADRPAAIVFVRAGSYSELFT